MTTVYGVTFIGAKRQIQRQLRDRGDVPLEDQFRAATYLAERVLSSIGDLFQGATAIQIWLSVCARLIGRAIRLDADGALPAAKDPMASVTWTTPLGLPVAQPYRKQKKTQVLTALQSVFITDPNAPAQIDGRAQATAFPPNYVHSLDATHMMLTAIDCQREGLAFASVHDSYWTHACDVDRMSGILRDCFIRLHSQDLLGDLRRDFARRYADFVVKQGAVTKYAQSLKSKAESQDVDGRSGHHLAELAKDMGPSALPPLAVAAERKLMADALRDAAEARTEEQEEALEEKSFLPDEEAEIEAAPTADAESADGKKKKKAKKAKAGSSKQSKTPKTKPTASKNTYLSLCDLLPEVPPKGTFDLERIRNSPYFFS
jgi:DNA-directed RNA polymerase